MEHFDQIILADDYIVSSDCAQTGLNNNILLTGSSGSGKTMSYVEANLLHVSNRNLMLVIRKPKMLQKYTPILKERGYQVDVLDFCHPNNSTVSFDPMHYIQDYLDLQHLCRSVIKANPDKQHQTSADPYWDEAATSLLLALSQYCLLTIEEGKCTFADVVDLYKRMKVDYSDPSNISTSLDSDFDRLERLIPGNEACANWRVFRELPPRTAGCVLSGMASTMAHLWDPTVLQMFRMSNDLEFASFTKEKRILFIVVSPVNPAMDALVSMFYGTALKELFELAQSEPNGSLPIPVHLMCDDCCSGAPIANLPQMMSIIREANLSMSLVCQSNSQMDGIYGQANAISIRNCCDTMMYTGGTDLSTAHDISLRLDLPLCDVLAMPVGHFAIFRRGSKPFIQKRYQILEDPLYQEVVRRFEESQRQIMPLRVPKERSSEITFAKAPIANDPQINLDSFRTELEDRFDRMFELLNQGAS